MSGRGPRLLIVNADDYGLTTGVSAGIVHAMEHGIVTSTSVLAVAPAANRTLSWLDDRSVGIGAHLAVVGEDPPLLSASEIPSLVDRTGRLPSSWRALVRRLARGLIDADDLRREMGTQIDAITASGLRLTHLDTHQHVHLWPRVGAVVIQLGLERGVGAVRVPRPSSRGPKGQAILALAQRLHLRVEAAGLRATSWAAGLDEAGHVNGRVLHRVLAVLAARGLPSVELNVHPGEADDDDRARYKWGYSWGDELAALTSPSTKDLVKTLGFDLGTYDDLARMA